MFNQTPKTDKTCLNSATSEKSKLIKTLLYAWSSTKILYKACVKEKCTQQLDAKKQWGNDCDITNLDETIGKKLSK